MADNQSVFGINQLPDKRHVKGTKYRMIGLGLTPAKDETDEGVSKIVNSVKFHIGRRRFRGGEELEWVKQMKLSFESSPVDFEILPASSLNRRRLSERGLKEPFFGFVDDQNYG